MLDHRDHARGKTLGAAARRTVDTLAHGDDQAVAAQAVSSHGALGGLVAIGNGHERDGTQRIRGHGGLSSA